MANANLSKAKAGKNDEFYTQYADIQKEVNAYLEYNADVFRNKTILLPCDDPEWSNFTKFFAQNFEQFGIRKLISTSYAPEAKKIKSWSPTLFESESPYYDADKSKTNGKIFILDHDTDANGRTDIDDLEWSYLESNGDFRSDEVKRLRDEADIIITNPPFSLFREFVKWIMEADKKFLIIGNQNAITYKEIFPLIKENKIWLGYKSGDMSFRVPANSEERATRFWIDTNGQKWRSLGNICWYTNLDIPKRHENLILYKSYTPEEYPRYINYDAIEVSKTELIPCDYDGVMGVPITFMDKYNPDQFEIIGIGNGGELGVECGVSANLTAEQCAALFREDKSFRKGKLCYRNDKGKLIGCYARILIRKRA